MKSLTITQVSLRLVGVHHLFLNLLLKNRTLSVFLYSCPESAQTDSVASVGTLVIITDREFKLVLLGRPHESSTGNERSRIQLTAS